jgi:hypothetical protein
MTDEIVAEVRRAREAYAKRFNYDLRAIFADIKKQQADSEREFVSLPAKRIPPLTRKPSNLNVDLPPNNRCTGHSRVSCPCRVIGISNRFRHGCALKRSR